MMMLESLYTTILEGISETRTFLYEKLIKTEDNKRLAEEKRILSQVKDGIYKGDIDIQSIYRLPNLKGVTVTGYFRCNH